VPLIKMSRGEALSFYGPAVIAVAKGLIDVFYRKFTCGEKLVVHRLRNYIVYAIEESELDVNLGPGAQIQQVDPEEPYFERRVIAEDITGKGYEKVVLIGGVDAGKSTLAILLSNLALEKNMKPAVIDGDVGQADIGPPGFVTLSYPDQQVVWMRELKPKMMRFIGDIKPQHHVDQIIHAILELVETALSDQRKPVIIDTDGWIGDEYAVDYKYRLVSALKPDAVVVVGEEIAGAFKRFESLGVKVYVTRTPVNRRTRSREERRMLRRDKYCEFLEKAGEKKLDLASIVVVGHPLFYSVEVAKPQNTGLQDSGEILYTGKLGDTLVVLAKHVLRNESLEYLKKLYGVDKVKLYVAGFEKKLYAAVSDGFRDYPALVERVDLREKTIVLKTSFDGEVKIVKLSCIRLAEDYSEQVAGASG